jgi:hypothetical protein
MSRAKYTLKMSVKRVLRKKSEPKGKEGDAENCMINYTIRICTIH